MEFLRKLRARLLAEYLSGLLTSYLAMGANIVAQIILVPIYLATLGTVAFGTLTLVLSAINYASVGIGWLSGGLQRLLGQAYGMKDHAGFAKNIGAGKILFVGYGVAAAGAGVALFFMVPHASLRPAAVVLAALFLIANYELAVERQGLVAAGRQAASNLLQAVQVSFYAISVTAALYSGLGLVGVFACQLGSMLGARCFVPLAWQGARPAETHATFDAVRRLVRRLASRMGAGYFVIGMLVLSSQSDVLVVGWLGGAEAAARFVLIWKIADVGVQMLWRMSESLIPILVRLDAVGDRKIIRQRYRRVGGLLLVSAVAGGIAYATLGPWITRLWLGPAHAPQDPLGFVLAGAGIVWLGIAKLPAIVAYSTARFRLWNALYFLEITARFGLTVALYPRFGYLAPIVALNIVHICGMAIAYQLVGRKLLAG